MASLRTRGRLGLWRSWKRLAKGFTGEIVAYGTAAPAAVLNPDLCSPLDVWFPAPPNLRADSPIAAPGPSWRASGTGIE
jgi:hypothetical protein